MIRTKGISILISFFAVLSLGTTCEPPFEVAYRITIKNGTSNKLAFLVSNTYPDTIISVSSFSRIPPNDISFYDSRQKWQEVFKTLPRDTISIFYSLFGYVEISTHFDKSLVAIKLIGDMT
jgi:hypothetical protein